MDDYMETHNKRDSDGPDQIFVRDENVINGVQKRLAGCSSYSENQVEENRDDLVKSYEEAEDDLTCFAVRMHNESQGEIVKIQPSNQNQEDFMEPSENVENYQYQSEENDDDNNEENIVFESIEMNRSIENNVTNENNSAHQLLVEVIPLSASMSECEDEQNQPIEDHINESSPKKRKRYKLESIANKLLMSGMLDKKRRKKPTVNRCENASFDALAVAGDTFVVVVSESEDELSSIETAMRNTHKVKTSIKSRKKKKRRNERVVERDRKIKITGPSKKTKLENLKMYTCRKCEMQFRTSVELKVHRPSHKQDRPYSCDKCGKAFLTSTHLERHRVMHNKKKIIYECSLCPKRFLTQSNLDMHLRVHAGERPYCCTVCNMTFTQQGHLYSHTKTHLEIKPHACTHEGCTKTFSRRSDLANHVRTHTGEKPFMCPTCGKCFAQRGYMEIHAKGHTGVKEHSCECCGKKFTRKSGVTRHMRIHTGVKPYVCEVCGKGFVQSGELKTHSRQHTGAKPYSCPKCNKRFTQSVNKNKHVKKCTKVPLAEMCEKIVNFDTNQNSEDIGTFQKLLEIDFTKLANGENEPFIENTPQ